MPSRNPWACTTRRKRQRSTRCGRQPSTGSKPRRLRGSIGETPTGPAYEVGTAALELTGMAPSNFVRIGVDLVEQLVEARALLDT